MQLFPSVGKKKIQFVNSHNEITVVVWKKFAICEISPFGSCGRNLAGYLMRYTLGHDLCLQSWMTSNNMEMWFMSQAMMMRF